MTDCDEAAKLLRERIEDLSDRPPAYSRTAYTSRLTIHTLFRDGHRMEDNQEGRDYLDPASLETLIERTFKAVVAHMKTVAPPQLLVWRIEPQFERFGDPEGALFRSYVRLCFETDLARDGQAESLDDASPMPRC